MRKKYVRRRRFLLFFILALALAAVICIKLLPNRLGGNAPEPEPSPATPTSIGNDEEDTDMAESPDTLPETDTEPEAPSVSEPAEPASSDTESWKLILVNSKNKLPENFEVSTAKITENYYVDERIADSLNKMIAAAKEDGVSLMLCSAHRSIDYQTQLFEKKKNEFMAAGKSESEATQATASMINVPGTSEHHTGLAVDIVTPEFQNLIAEFDTTPAYKWLDAHAHEYGFILRYPIDKQEVTGIIYEPWHYRYVGIEHAKTIKQYKICLEEYLDVFKGKPAGTIPAPDQAEEDGTQ